MHQYTVLKGDTIAKVTKLLHTDWKTLQAQNPKAIGRSKLNGNWFVREGARLSVDKDKGSFSAHLDKAVKKHDCSRSTTAKKPDTFTQYTVQPGDTVWSLSVRKFHVDPRELISDNSITDPELLQIGQKLEIRKKAPQPPCQVVASWYGKDFHGKPMANGDIYDMYANTIAHKDLPLGTAVELKNPRTGQTTSAVVTDRGPYVEGRDVDLSYGLASKLSMVENGVDTLVMRIL